MCTPCRQTFNDIDAIRILTNVVLAFVHIQNHNIVLVVDFEEVLPAGLPTFTCSKLPTETPEQCVKCSKSTMETAEECVKSVKS